MDELDVIRLPVGPVQANAYLLRLRGRAEAVLIDPGDDLNALRRAIDSRALKPTDILLTHGHFDHMLSAEALRHEYGARVWIREPDEPMLKTPQGALYDASYAVSAFEPVQNVDLLPDGGRITLAGLAIDVLPCPGHTPGGASFYLPAHGALFTGDTLFVGAIGRTDLPGGDGHALFQSIRALLKLPPDTIAYPGHGREAPLSRIDGGRG